MLIRTMGNHTKPGEWINYEELIKHVKTDHQFSEIPSLHLDESIKKLSDKNEIKIEGQKLFLYQSTRDTIKANVDQFQSLEKTVMENLRFKLKEKISDLNSQQESIIINNFQELIQKTLEVYGSVAAKLFADKNNDIMKLKNYEGFQTLYQNKIQQAVNKKFHKSLDMVFNDFFFKPSNELCQYFFASAQGYVIYEILNLDPTLKKMTKISWQKKRIYLDTNVLLHLLCDGSHIHDSISTLIIQTQKLGAQLFITEKTVEEFQHVLESFKNRLKHLHIKQKFTSSFEDSNNDSPILLTYIKKIKEKDFSQESFIKTYENFEQTVTSQHSISIEAFIDTILENKNADDLKSHINSRSISKKSAVIEHDAYNILRVRNLRKKGTADEIGPKSWLITTDKTLFKAEQDTYSSEEFTASITTEIWLQIISPFISPELAYKDTSFAFTKLLSTNFHSHKISAANISTLMSLFIDDTKFSTQQFRKIIGDEFIQKKLEKIQDSIDEGKEVSDKQFKELMNRSLKIVEDDFKQQQKESDDIHSKELEKMKNNIDELRQEVSNLQKEKIEIESKTSNRIFELKFSVIFIICAAVFDSFLVYGLSLISEFIFGTIVTTIGIFGIEAGIYYLIAKFTYKRRTTSTKGHWSRTEILTLIGVIIAGITLAMMVFLALFPFNQAIIE